METKVLQVHEKAGRACRDVLSTSALPAPSDAGRPSSRVEATCHDIA